VVAVAGSLVAEAGNHYLVVDSFDLVEIPEFDPAGRFDSDKPEAAIDIQAVDNFVVVPAKVAAGSYPVVDNFVVDNSAPDRHNLVPSVVALYFGLADFDWCSE